MIPTAEENPEKPQLGDALYTIHFVSFLLYLFLQTRSFEQHATLAAF